MNARFGRRLFLAAALVAALTLPLSALWAQSGERPALKEMLSAARTHITEITPAQAQSLMSKGGTVFVDVRTDAEWAGGHLPGATHLDRGKLEFDVEKAIPDKATPMVVYCKSGDRGALSAQTLTEMGYTHVVNMAGGFMAWEKAGYEVAK
jgi:rhodanese-related sulfurtransferase